MSDLAKMIFGILSAPFPVPGGRVPPLPPRPSTTKGAPVATTPSRIYQVTVSLPAGKEGEPEVKRLVRATHPGHALRHVAEGILTVEVASPDAVYNAARAGIEVEEITGGA